MHLKQEENVIKTYHHHGTAFFFKLLRIAIVSLPFYFVAYFFSGVLTPGQMVYLYVGVTALMGVFGLLDLGMFYLDKLIVTNHRVILVTWRGLNSRTESEAEISDIQEITTIENGLFSVIPFFDYGKISFHTVSAKTVLIFTDAPDPEGIKHFIYHLEVKPSRIEPARVTTSGNDSARKEFGEREEAGVPGRQ
jgi:hypothetical protein